MSTDHTYNQIIEFPFSLQGLQTQFTIRPYYKDPNDERNTGGSDGLPGEYIIFFTLSRPGFSLHDEYTCDFTSLLRDNFDRGNSHLMIKNSSKNINNIGLGIDIEIKNEDGQFRFIGYPNERGFLSTFKVRLSAINFHDAEQKAYRALSPLLSNMSVFFDTPLYIHEVCVTETRTHSLSMTKINPFREIAVSLPNPLEGGYAKEFLFCASLYREALNSNSFNYQYLCFYKIIEIAKRYLTRLNAEAVKNGKSIVNYNERIPQNNNDQVKWLNYIYTFKSQWDQKELVVIFLKESVGKKLNDVIDNQFRHIRIDIAHAFLGSGVLTLLVDEKQHIDKITYWLPLTKCVARLLLKRAFPDQFLIVGSN